jgi:hypothetical protein
MSKKRIVPEFQVRTDPPRRAGFIPTYFEEEADIEVWQVWLRSADGEDNRRATFGDMKAAGFKPRRSAMFDKKKTKPKPRPGY